MITVTADTTTQYYFTNEAEEKIKNYSEKNGLNYVSAIYDLIDMGELDLELDSEHENTDEPNIIKAEEM